jgi:hypothetical protein
MCARLTQRRRRRAGEDGMCACEEGMCACENSRVGARMKGKTQGLQG